MAMKTLFLGGLAARVAPRILGKMDEKLDTNVLAELTDMQRLIPALAEAEIMVGHIWRSDFPEAPRLKLLQAATAGVDMIDLPSLPRGITLCNVFGHEPAIAEYVLMMMLSLTHRLLETVDGIPGRVMGGTPTRRWITSRRAVGEDSRDHGLWPYRPRGGEACGRIWLQSHRREP